MENDQIRAHSFTYSAFWNQVTDAAFFAILSMDSPHHVDRLARASVLSSALSLECAANRCLDSLKLSRKTHDDLDKLGFLAKFDSFIGFTDRRININRGDGPVQSAQQLKTIRDHMVHPKALKTEVREGTQKGAPVIVVEKYRFLDIPKISLLWNSEHAGRAFAAVFNFYNYIFKHLLKMNDKDIGKILLPTSEVEGFNDIIFWPSDHYLERAAKTWNVDIKLLYSSIDY